MYEIERETAHLVVTSPPYPMIQKWDKQFNSLNFYEQHTILGQTWEECFRILVPGGICCINIGDATRSIDGVFQCFPNYAEIVSRCKRIGFVPLVPIIWKKISNRPNAFMGSGFLPPNGYVSQDCEYIAIMRKGPTLRKFPPKDRNRYNSLFTKYQRDIWFQQIWEIPGARGASATSSFPREIPERLIRMFSVIGDLAVDPFCGTNTTGIVAAELNRKYIGYNIE
jgi:site-specific DNA-methyltransferase (cytosine-N4-specific)